ncbi:NEAT domain-containing protein [Sporosarcina sp. G11-34]|uniref:NEAT domain-containing protein n=1 Tax=Sporosarcina sp. G11-34 TaxID=2849605 RepID=UPI0022A997B8|nr:NEAT domain-containing protein [Sporosarcina sp. G11-34]MCZ2258574.1 NEAT domain-containing protein [Sporosarcina sp. G11-34]
MRKKWILPIVMALFTLPFFSGAVFAEEKVVYVDGEYPITAKAINADTGGKSGAAGFLEEDATLNIVDGKATLTITVLHNEMAEISGLQIEGVQPEVKKGEAEKYLTFKLATLKKELNAQVQYVVPMAGIDHDVPLKFVLEGIDKIPVVVEEPIKPEEKPTEPTKPEEKPAEPTKPTKPEGKPTDPKDPEETPTKPEKPSVPKAIDLTDGFYTIKGSFLHLEEEKASSMARYLGSSMFLEVVNGKVELTVTVSEDETVTLLKVDGKNAVKSKVDGKKRYDTYELDSLATVLNGYAEYQAPMGNGKIHYGKADFRISLADESIVKTEASAKPGYEKEAEVEVPAKPEKPAQPEKPSKPEQPIVTDGDKDKGKDKNKNSAQTPDKAYKINYVSESGSVNRQFNNPAVLLYKDGEKYIQMTGTGGQYIESLTINGTEVTWGKKNADGTFTFEFKVEGSLSDVLKFGMRINTGFNIMQHDDIGLSFDESTQKAANIKDYTLLTVINDPKEEGKVPPKPEKPSKGEELVNKEKPADKGKNKPKTPAKKDQLVPDKAYKIGFVIKHETEDKPSAADSFFKGPAILLYKNGEKYIQVTVTNSQFIDSLTTKHGDMVLVKDNGDGSMVVQFKVDGKISDVIDLNMIITVPGVYEGAKHIARLFLDESSMKEIDASDYLLAASSNGNGPSAEGEPDKDIPLPGAKENPPKTNNNDTNNNKNTKNDPTIEKPKFGSNGTNKSIIETVIAGKEKNPQTGDTTNILLYVLLLIGSAIPLAVMAKRRFAKVA